MPEANFTDIHKMMIVTAYKNGLKVGENISRAIESGELVVPDNETLEVLINSFYTYEYPMYQRVLAKIDSPKFSTAGNIDLAASGLCLAEVSTQNYFKTKNPIARVCYAASIMCSSTAVLTSSVKAINNACGISYFAMCGDPFGSTFLFLGNRAQNLGHYAEGKSKMPQLNLFRNRSFKRKPSSLTEYKGMGVYNSWLLKYFTSRDPTNNNQYSVSRNYYNWEYDFYRLYLWKIYNTNQSKISF
jgi:hypothetical protein